MNIKLPRECSGQEIVDALKIASQILPQTEILKLGWKVESIKGGYEYEPGSVKQIIHRIGLIISSPYRFTDIMPIFELIPISSSDSYREIELGVSMAEHGPYRRVYSDKDKDGARRFTIEFERIRPYFERFLAEFYSLLNPQQA